MATEVSKFSVYDPRIVQTQPKYAVEKGAQSITNVNVKSQTADLSSVQFNVQVPSENVFIDRAVRWSATQVASITLTADVSGGGNIPAGTDLSGLLGPAAFPLHQSVSQMSATINDATVTVNTKDVLPQILRLADLADSRRQRTCPTMLDRYAQYPDSRVVPNTPLATWAETTSSDEVPNSGFLGWAYCTAVGALVDNDVVGDVTYVRGVPTLTANAGDGDTVTFYVRWTSTELLVLPPFLFAAERELSTGLFGVQNFQVQMNMAPNPSRSLRASTRTTLASSVAGEFGTFSAGAPAWVSPGAYGMFLTQPVLQVQFLTPSLSLPLPPKSIVPWMEYPRYITSQAGLVPVTNILDPALTPLHSQTITLPNIPDLIMIYAKKQTYSVTDCDFVLPVSKISINFDNFSGLLANHSQEELYKMSVDNGVDMDFSEWSGQGRVPLSVANGAGVTKIGGVLGLCGGPLVLRPGRDFALQEGQAAGLVGNFTLQFDLSVKNASSAAVNPDIYVVPISSGFFETIKGSSRIIKGVLTEQDILGAPAQAPSADLQRPVGAGMRGGKHGPSGMSGYM